jgi:hypothetical protein
MTVGKVTGFKLPYFISSLVSPAFLTHPFLFFHPVIISVPLSSSLSFTLKSFSWISLKAKSKSRGLYYVMLFSKNKSRGLYYVMLFSKSKSRGMYYVMLFLPGAPYYLLEQANIHELAFIMQSGVFKPEVRNDVNTVVSCVRVPSRFGWRGIVKVNGYSFLIYF